MITRVGKSIADVRLRHLFHVLQSEIRKVDWISALCVSLLIHVSIMGIVFIFDNSYKKKPRSVTVLLLPKREVSVFSAFDSFGKPFSTQNQVPPPTVKQDSIESKPLPAPSASPQPVLSTNAPVATIPPVAAQVLPNADGSDYIQHEKIEAAVVSVEAVKPVEQYNGAAYNSAMYNNTAYTAYNAKSIPANQDVISGIIKKKIVYPPEAQKKHLEGSLVISFQVNEDGSLADLLISKSSGHQILDEAAENAVIESAPFSTQNQKVKLEVTIDFKLPPKDTGEGTNRDAGKNIDKEN